MKELTNHTYTRYHRVVDEKAVQTSLLTTAAATVSPKRRHTPTDHSEDDTSLLTPTAISPLPTRYASSVF